jgi:hypothetical protein
MSNIITYIIVFFDQLIDCYFFQIIILGEVGDPSVKASIAVDDVSFENKCCDKLPQGKFVILLHSCVISFLSRFGTVAELLVGDRPRPAPSRKMTNFRKF